MTKKWDDGFSLIEALVALAVLALSAMSLLAAAEAHIARISSLEWRALARIAAENRLAELEIGQPEGTDQVEMLDQLFVLNVARSATEDPDLDRIDITVTDDKSESLGGFLGFMAGTPAQ